MSRSPFTAEQVSDVIWPPFTARTPDQGELVLIVRRSGGHPDLLRLVEGVDPGS